MRFFYVLLLLFLSFFTLNAFAQAPVKPLADPGVHFVQNQKQWEKEIEYRANVPGGFLHVREGGHLLYSFYDVNGVHKHLHPHSPEDSLWVVNNPEIQAHGVAVDFVGSQPNAKARPVFGQILPFKYNYFRGKDPAKWARNVLATNSLRVQELYPGIDLTLFGKGNAFKYEFIVKPHTNPAQVRMHYRGANALSLTPEGHLRIATNVQDFVEQKPFVYQRNEEGDTLVVQSRYHLDPETQEVSFELLEEYNPDLALIIDPLVVFSTFSGATSDHWGNTATYDEDGNLYAGGTMFGNGFPATVGAFSLTYAGDTDVSIMKYNDTGSGLLYATFLGGQFSEVPHSLIVNNAGDLVIFGTTSSADFPTSAGAFDGTFNGGTFYNPWGSFNASLFRQGTDCFISTLSADGSTLLASTFLGGSGNDGVNERNGILTRNYGDQLRGEVVVDVDDNVYIATTTSSPDFPLQNPTNPTFSTKMGAAAKLSPNLSNLLWSTYLGGSDSDAAYALRVARNGDVYVVGGTTSSDFQEIQPSGFQPISQPSINGFLIALDPNGQGKYGTYISGAGYDQTYFVALDDEDSVYVLGQTHNVYAPVPNSVYYNSNSGIFIQKYNPELSQRHLSTLFGSGISVANISPTAFMVNDCNHIYFGGWGGGINVAYGYADGRSVSGMPITPNALRATTNGDDFYFAVLTDYAHTLYFGSYFGDPGTLATGDHVDGGTSRFDPATGEIYHSACACTGNGFTTTPGAHSTTNNSPNCNNAAFRLSFDELEADFETYDNNSFGVRSGCAPFTFGVDNRSQNATTYFWDFGDGTTTTQVDSFYHTYANPGTYRIKLIASNPNFCYSDDSTFITIEVFPSDFTVSADQTICTGGSTRLQATGGTSYLWTPATGLSDANVANPLASPANTTTYTVEAENQFGCRDTLQVTVTVDLANTLNANFEVLVPDSCVTRPEVQVNDLTTGLTPDSYFWDFGNGQTSTSPNPPPVAYDRGTAYTITLVVTASTCVSEFSQVVEFPTFNFEISEDVTICAGEETQLSASGGVSYAWTPTTGLDDPTSPTPLASPTQTTTYTAQISTINGCTEDLSVTVTAIPLPVVELSADQVEFCEDETAIFTASGADEYIFFLNDTAVQTDLGAIYDPDVGVLRDGSEIYVVGWSLPENCRDTSDVITVNVRPLPYADLGLPWREKCPEDTLYLDVYQSSSVNIFDYSYDWRRLRPDGTTDQVGIGHPQLAVVDSGRYFVIITDLRYPARCQFISDTVTVAYQFRPKVGVDSVLACRDEAPFPLVAADLAHGPSVLYEWEDAFNPGLIISTDSVYYVPDPGGTFFVSVTDTLTGCTARDTVALKYNPVPQFIIVGHEVPICDRLDTLIIQASNVEDLEITWQGPDGVSPQVMADPRFAVVNQSGIYTATVTDTRFPTRCSASRSIEVVVNPIPDLGLPDSVEVCEEDSVYFNLYDFRHDLETVYRWTNIETQNVVSDSAALLVRFQDHNSYASFRYEALVRSPHGCEKRDTVKVRFKRSPTISLNALPETLCEGDSVWIFAEGGEAYRWIVNGEVVQNNGLQDYVFNASQSGIFTIEVYSEYPNGCLPRYARHSFRVFPRPEVDLPDSLVACEDETIRLNGFQFTHPAGSRYLWRDLRDTSYTLSTDSLYFLRLTDLQPASYDPVKIELQVWNPETGCVGKDTVTVEFDRRSALEILRNFPDSLCFSDTITLTAQGADSVLWSTGDIGKTLQFLPPHIGYHRVMASGLFPNACGQTADTVWFYVRPQPEITLNTVDTLRLCVDDTLYLFPSGGQNYTWAHNPNLSGNLVEVASRSRWYKVRGYDETGCWGEDSVFVEVTPTVDLPPYVEACEGERLEIGAESPVPARYFWAHNGARTPFTEVREAGTYRLRVSVDSCTYWREISVNFLPVPRLEILADTTLCFELSAAEDYAEARVHRIGYDFLNRQDSLEALGQIRYIQTWRDSTGNFIGSGDSVDITKPGIYFARVIAEYSPYHTQCSDSAQIAVDVACEPRLFVPDIFTPNADGLNDYFQLFGKHIRDVELLIFDRWGTLVFKLNAEDFEDVQEDEWWDGTYLGAFLPDGQYAWTIKYRSKAPGDEEANRVRIRQGAVYLVR